MPRSFAAAPDGALRPHKTGHKSAGFAAIAVISLVLHVVVLGVLRNGAHAAQPPRPEPIRMSFRALAPEPKVEPRQEAPAAPAPQVADARPTRRSERSRDKSPARAEPSAPAKPVTPSTPQPAAALDFTGVTLTGTSSAAGFAQVAGNGQHMAGALAAAPRSTGGLVRSQGNGTPGATVVPLASLKRPPRAPVLDEALVRNYPKSARDQGRTGEALVRARILPDGQVGPTQVLLASAPEFGRACQHSLAGSRWSPPLDESGRPVATDVSYKCLFEVTR